MMEHISSEIIEQVISAVCYLDSNNIVHMDIKPENILFESKKENHIRLIDFHYAQLAPGTESLVLPEDIALASKMEEDEVLGTPYYIAPEVIKGSYGKPSDMWSIGVITYMMLTGVPPFNSKDAAEILGKVSLGQYSTLTLKECGCSIDAIDFIEKLLQLDP